MRSIDQSFPLYCYSYNGFLGIDSLIPLLHIIWNAMQLLCLYFVAPPTLKLESKYVNYKFISEQLTIGIFVSFKMTEKKHL